MFTIIDELNSGKVNIRKIPEINSIVIVDGLYMRSSGVVYLEVGSI